MYNTDVVIKIQRKILGAYMTNNKVAKVKNLAKDTGLFAISGFGSKILLFLLTPLYTSILSTEQYGIADLINTTINFVYPVMTLSIAEATLRYSMEKNLSKKAVFNNTLLITLVSFILVLIIKPFIGLIDEALSVYWFYFIAIYCLNNIQLSVSNFVKGTGKTTLFAITGIIQTVVIIVSNILFLVVFKFEIDGYLWSIIIGYAISTLVMFWFGEIYIYIFPLKFDKKLLKEMLVYSIPMIPTIIAWAINTSIDKYMIVNMVGMSDNGVYSVAHKIPTILTTILMIFLNAWQLAAISNYGEDDESEFQTDIYSIFNIVGLIGCFVILIANKFLASILFANDFYVAWHYVPFLTASAFFSALAGFLAAAYRAAKKTKSLFVSVLVGAVVNIFLNYILLNWIGILGAAVATGLSFFVVWFIRIVMVQKIVEIRIDISKTIFTYALFFFAVIIESIDVQYSICYSVGALVIVIIIYFQSIKRIVIVLKSIIRRKLKKQNSV